MIFGVVIWGMKSILSATGTASLLAELSPYIPDEFINDLLPRSKSRGRRCHFNAAQLWRVHLLALLSPVHTFNLLIKMLGEQRAWRRFAHLSHRQRVPDALMLHEFRNRMGVDGLRCINEKLLESFIPKAGDDSRSVALIDATDLPASASGFKKNGPDVIRPNMRPWARGL